MNDWQPVYGPKGMDREAYQGEGALFWAANAFPGPDVPSSLNGRRDRRNRGRRRRGSRSTCPTESG